VPGHINAAFAGEGFNRVARHQANEEEGEQRHAEEGRDDEAQSCKDESKHEGVDSRHVVQSRSMIWRNND